MADGPTIVGVRVSTIARDLHGQVWNPALRWMVKHAVFIEIDMEEGATGLGECWCFDSEPDALIAFLRTEVLPALVGQTTTEARDAICQQWARATLTARHGLLATAHSGLDLALWDLAAQRAGIPLWQAFDRSGSGDCAVYASGGLYAEAKGPADVADELASYVKRGFRAVKMKVGGASADEDIARVRDVRDRIGPDVSLIIDAVASLDSDSALALFERLDDDTIDAFQAPIPPSDLQGMRKLCRAGVPVMAGEAEYREEIFAELLEGKAVKILQVAPIACGGPSRALDLARRCDDAGIGLSFETSSTGIATLAALHLGAAISRTKDVEIHQVHDVLFREAGITDPLEGNGRMRPPATPGLGIRLPERSAKLQFELKLASFGQKPTQSSIGAI